MRTLFKNASLVLPDGIFDGEVVVEGSLITQVSKASKHHEGGFDRVIDCHGCYLMPGFIDIHTHGGGGHDFMDGSADDIYEACRMHLMHGTTTMLPTTLTSTRESMIKCIGLFNSIDLKRPGCPEILGLHLEGPYFAYEQRGAQDPRFLRNPDPEEYNHVLSMTDRIRRWSFAVELPGSDAFLEALERHAVIPSIAHTAATCAQVEDAYAKGVSLMTHFYSGMNSVTRKDGYRIAGALEAGYLLDDMYVEVIADGHHLPKELLRLIYKVKGPERICLVTDSMRAAGMPDGRYLLGTQDGGVECISEGGVAKLPDRSAFAGSVATADRLVKTMTTLAGVPLHESVEMASLIPARVMGISHRKGSIGEGKDADLVIMDKDFSVRAVMVRGTMLLL